MIDRIREARRRFWIGLGLAAALGLTVGVALAGAESLIDALLTPLRRAPLAVQAVVPAAALLVVWLVMRTLGGGASPFVSDEYLKAYHDPSHPIDLRLAPARVITGIVTLAGGAAMGAEALGIYVGSCAATVLGRRLDREHSRILLVAGAAAGVSAVFKAPATGAVFALEVPYMQDMAAGAVLPALVGAAVAYLAVALTQGTSPILTIGADPRFGVSELLGALLVGAVCGLGARGFLALVSRGKDWALAHGAVGRVVPAGAALAGFVLVSDHFYHQPFTLGAGYDVITWATDPHRGLWLVAGLFVLRLLATSATQWGGGTGGTFVPLVVQGALLGRLVQGGLNELGASTGGNLFVLVGMAAFLSAGYRVPLAAVMFVAETTGKPGFIVPGLLACAVANLMMGRKAASPYQQVMRSGHVERRFELPVGRVVRPGAYVVRPDTTIEDLIQEHLPTAGARVLPVVAEDGVFVGVVRQRDVVPIARADRATTPVSAVLCDLPTAEPGWPLRRAIETMHALDLPRLAVVDETRHFVGMITLSDIVGFDELVENEQRVTGAPADVAAERAAQIVTQLPAGSSASSDDDEDDV